MEGNIIEPFRFGLYEVALSHLQFVDDMMLFCSSNEDSFLILNHMVRFFEVISILKTNGSAKFWGLTTIKLSSGDGQMCSVMTFVFSFFLLSFVTISKHGLCRVASYMSLMFGLLGKGRMCND